MALAIFRCVKGAACGPRRILRGINYSQKTVTVEFLFARPPDGKSLLNQRPTLAAPRAAPLIRTSAENRKGSNRFSQSDPSPHMGAEKNGEVFDFTPTFCVSFPNIAHRYWDNFNVASSEML